MTGWVRVDTLALDLGVSRETIRRSIASGKWRARSDSDGVLIEAASLPEKLRLKVEAKERELTGAQTDGAPKMDALWFSAQVELELLPPGWREEVQVDFGALIAARLEIVEFWKAASPTERKKLAGKIARMWSSLAKPLEGLYPQLTHLPFPTVLDSIVARCEAAAKPAELVKHVLDLPLVMNRDTLHAINKEAGLLV